MKGITLINRLDPVCTGNCEYCDHAVYARSTDPFGDEYIVDCDIAMEAYKEKMEDDKQ